MKRNMDSQCLLLKVIYWFCSSKKHIFTDEFVSPQIKDGHHHTSWETQGSSHLQSPVLFCLHLEKGLVGKERQRVRMTSEASTSKLANL